MEIDSLFISILWVISLLGGTALFALAAVYAERKVSAFIQDRLGPMEVGPYGLLQTLADIIKLLLKENIVNQAADKLLFLFAPIVVFISVFAGLGVIPWGANSIAANLNVGLLYVVAIVSIDVVGLLMAGWGANNKYALYGAARAVSQIISYEIPAGLAILATAAMYGSLNLNTIVLQQGILAEYPTLVLGIWDSRPIGGIVSWGIVRYPHLLVGFIIYFIAGLAECNRAPFDMPEAESELVAGFHTEYSGFRFAVLFLAEYANMLLVSLVASILFLGGWNTPLPNLIPLDNPPHSFFESLQYLQFAQLTTGTPDTWSAYTWAIFWLLLKAFLLIFVQMWIRWTYPRLRPDQLMRLCWQYLTPFGLGLVLISALFKLFELSSN